MHWPESAGDSCWLLVDEGSKKDLLEQLDWNCSRIMYYQSPVLTARNHPTQPKRLSSMSCDAACCPKEETCSCRHQIIRFASVCWMTGLVLTQERQGTLKCAHHLGDCGNVLVKSPKTISFQPDLRCFFFCAKFCSAIFTYRSLV